ncbi:FAD-dependent monooxygenase [Streptomyces sp. NPDC050534]|uniref:FAD-dependent monooxygenase n=1 Tax=Streptomyces sp. NPDC050534 TaxID=3365625 RepID=UPI003790EEEE
MMHNGIADDADGTTDVVVVGGGPVGLMLAGELRAGGVRVLVLEKLLEPPGHDRAGALHTRTVEMLDLRGLLDGFLEGTQLAKGLPFAGLFSQGLDFGLMETRHPYTALVPQSRTEELLARHADRAGVRIRRGHEVTGLRQDTEGVEVTAVGPHGPYRVRARYAVGCDGGRSTVRRLAGIGFPGTEATVTALIGYVHTPERDVPRRWERTPDGILILAFPPEGGTGRVVAIEYGREQAADEGPVTLDQLTAAVARVRGRPLELTEPVTWLSRFGDASRQAERYRSGRVLLAGDAAHVHFPIGGQGLNTGLQDAVNLGWKLAARIRGWGSEELLDTYHDERHPVAERVLLNTRAQLALMRPDEQHTTPLRGFVEELLGFDEVNRYFAGMITGTAVSHPTTFPPAPPAVVHPWAGRFAGHLVLSGLPQGTAAVAELLRPARPLLLDLAGRSDLREAAGPWAGRVSVCTGETALEPPAEALLVRPDGYVAWAGSADDTAEALRTALERWFGPPGSDHLELI